MKRISILLITILLLLLTVPAYAHPGKTDGNGGHYNRSTGEYHYHHGHPAHQHPNGVCPYDFDDRTGYNSGTSSGGSDNDTFSSGSGSGTSSGNSGSGSTTPSVRRGDSSAGNAANSWVDTLISWIKNIAAVILAVAVFGFAIIPVAAVFIDATLDKLKSVIKRRKPRRLEEPTTRPDEPPPLPPEPPAPPEPPKKRPHRLDLSDRFEVICGFREVTLYGLPAVRISHVGYLRDTRQLLIRFRDDNSVLLYDGVPLDVCSEFVRSSFPDQYYGTLIDGQFPAQRIR